MENLGIKIKARIIQEANYRLENSLADTIILKSQHCKKNPNSFGFRRLVFSNAKLPNSKNGDSIETLLLRMLAGLERADTKPKKEVKTKKEKSIDGTVVEIIESTEEDDNSKLNNKFKRRNVKDYLLDTKDFNPYDSNSNNIAYSAFMNEYLNSSYNSSYEATYDLSDPSEKDFRHGDEIMGYHERKKINEEMVMNEVMGKESTSISAEDKQKYEFWKAANKFNQMLSFVLYDKAVGLR